MHAYCEREKPVGMLTLGLDKARIYVNVSMDTWLRKELLVAQCKPELRKQYYHPNGISKEGTKIWLSKWVIWNMMETSAVSILVTIMEQLHPEVKELNPSDEVKALMVGVHKLFMDYVTKVRHKYFMMIWALKKEKKAPPMLEVSR